MYMKRVSLLFCGLALAAATQTAFVVFDSTAQQSVTALNEVKIGNQIWMSENLTVDKFRNGDPIPEAKSAIEWENAGRNKRPAWCYYKNDAEAGARYGKLYNWYAVTDPRGLAPQGWHLPTDEEWKTLAHFLGGDETCGKKLKNSDGWSDYEVWDDNDNPTGEMESGNGTNESGFAALPGGNRSGKGNVFSRTLKSGYWWSSSEDKDDNEMALYRYLYSSSSELKRGSSWKELGLSVRCIKD